MKNVLVGLILVGLTSQSIAQTDAIMLTEPITITLDEINVSSVNYKYLNDVGADEVAEPVKILERRVANFDLKNAEFYVDENQTYSVYFRIPEGSILAIYDGESGRILSTEEKFTDVSLPLGLFNSIIDNYLGWRIGGDVYLVKYRGDIRGTQRTYKILLEKDGKHKRIKTDDLGKTFI